MNITCMCLMSKSYHLNKKENIEAYEKTLLFLNGLGEVADGYQTVNAEICGLDFSLQKVSQDKTQSPCWCQEL